jgi:hypothetical protein
VAQAVGIVSVQADCVIEDAFLLLSERALEMDCTLDEVAVAVLDGSISFGDAAMDDAAGSSPASEARTHTYTQRRNTYAQASVDKRLDLGRSVN